MMPLFIFSAIDTLNNGRLVWVLWGIWMRDFGLVIRKYFGFWEFLGGGNCVLGAICKWDASGSSNDFN
jgi:hypothetical protein